MGERMDVSIRSAGAYAFGPFRLDPIRRRLTRDGEEVTLTPTALDTLIYLVEHPGRVVTKEELLDAVWPNRVVEEANIKQTVFTLRRALGEGGERMIATAPGRGYRFAEPVEHRGPVAAQAAAQTTTVGVMAHEPRPQLPPAIAPAAPKKRLGKPVLAVVAVCALAGIGGLVWLKRPFMRPAKPAPPVLYVAQVKPDDPQDKAVAADLTEQLRAAIGRVQGLKLVESTANAPPHGVDIQLDAELKHSGPDQLVDLVLRDTHTGERIWDTVIDGRTTITPSLQDRAVAAPVRYLSIWLGERLAGEPTAREPENPEALRLVQDAQRQLAAATEARQAQDLDRASQLYADAQHTADQALAIDKHSIGALMLKYRLLAAPEYPRAGEALQAFHARREQAAAVLAQAFADDPNAPTVLVAAAEQLRESLRWQDAGKLLERAVAIDPNSADANTWYAYHLGLLNQCDQAIRYGSLAASLDPSQSWRQLILPRMQLCKGRIDDAMSIYRTLFRNDRENVVILHDAYNALLGAHDAAGLRRWAAFAHKQWPEAPPPKIAATITRMEKAADALQGAPGPFLAMVDADAGLGPPGSKPHTLMFSRGDTNFILALEYGEAGATDRALDRLSAAIGDGALYLPWALPYGAAEFPAAMRASPRYQAIWRSRPELVALIEARRQAASPRADKAGGA
jgi:DNA-binding winged helix-turn-helix (wHTH) protein/tetratricopeptide (TPR) repeat protein